MGIFKIRIPSNILKSHPTTRPIDIYRAKMTPSYAAKTIRQARRRQKMLSKLNSYPLDPLWSTQLHRVRRYRIQQSMRKADNRAKVPFHYTQPLQLSTNSAFPFARTFPLSYLNSFFMFPPSSPTVTLFRSVSCALHGNRASHPAPHTRESSVLVT